MISGDISLPQIASSEPFELVKPRPTVHINGDAVQVVGHRRSKKKDDAGDIVDGSHTSKRDLIEDVLAMRFQLLASHFRLNEPGRDTTGDDVVFRAGAGNRAGEIDDRSFGGTVVGEFRLAAER